MVFAKRIKTQANVDFETFLKSVDQRFETQVHLSAADNSDNRFSVVEMLSFLDSQEHESIDWDVG